VSDPAGGFDPDLPLRWTPAAQERLIEIMATGAEPKVWYCQNPGRVCDGRPHEGYPYRHARSDQWPPSLRESWMFWIMLSGRGGGKALAFSTMIPTPTGWKKLEEIGVGDQVFDEAGRPCTVTATFDRIPERSYRLHFSDGTHLDACDEHQWVTWTHAERKAYLRSPYEDVTRFPPQWPAWRLRRSRGVPKQAPKVYPDSPGPQIRTTADIVATLTYGARGDRNHCIPVCGALDLPEADLPVPPYTLGAWLGDGSSATAEITNHDNDAQLLDEIRADGFTVTAQSTRPDKAPRFGIGTQPGRRDPLTGRMVANGSLQSTLREEGLLGNKHIPQAYLRASAAQRLALLQGLMDTDGYADPVKGTVEFTSTRRVLADGVVELARSLGQKPVLAEGVATLNGRVIGPKYRITWRATVQVFRLARKAARLRFGGAQGLRSHHRMIVAAEEIDAQPMRCLTVDSQHSMYLAGEAMIPTHNTKAGAEWIRNMTRYTPRLAIVAPTASDMRDVMIEGDSGLLRCCEAAGYMPHWEPSKKRLTFPNGAIAIGYTAEEPDRLRGRNDGAAWLDEAAHYPNVEYVWDMLMYGLRLGTAPRVAITTTPTPNPWLKSMITDPLSRVVVVPTFANEDNLAPTFVKQMREKYAGTRQGRQELYGEILEDVEGALWHDQLIERTRRHSTPLMHRVVVGVDPAGTSAARSDVTGIVVMGLGADGHLYVLDDRSGRYTPLEWANVVRQAYEFWHADLVVAETNYGGEMVTANLRTNLGDFARVRAVNSRRGKFIRAEPVFGLFEQDRAHLVGNWPELEGQLCSWVPGSGKSPDRVDAMVHGAHALVQLDSTSISVAHGRLHRDPGEGAGNSHLRDLTTMMRGALMSVGGRR
jgi:phage terminase large subunit-like protein